MHTDKYTTHKYTLTYAHTNTYKLVSAVLGVLSLFLCLLCALLLNFILFCPLLHFVHLNNFVRYITCLLLEGRVNISEQRVMNN